MHVNRHIIMPVMSMRHTLVFLVGSVVILVNLFSIARIAVSLAVRVAGLPIDKPESIGGFSAGGFFRLSQVQRRVFAPRGPVSFRRQTAIAGATGFTKESDVESCESHGAVSCEPLEGPRRDADPFGQHRCCCPPSRPCLRQGVHLQCMPCRGAFLAWREELGVLAEVATAGMLLSPRLTVSVLSALGADILPFARQSQADGGGADAADVCSLAQGAWLKSVFPHAMMLTCVRRLASDSFFWAVAVMRNVLGQLVFEMCMLADVFRRRVTLRAAALRILRRAATDCALLGIIFLVHSTVFRGADLVWYAVHGMCAYQVVAFMTEPLRQWRDGNVSHATVYLLALLLHTTQTDRPFWDTAALLCLSGPVADTALSIVGDWRRLHVAGSGDDGGGVGAGTGHIDAGVGRVSLLRGRRAIIVVDRKRFLESSVEQLAALSKTRLRHSPRVAYAADYASGSGAVIEDGVDFGGLRRDWLGRLAEELTCPEAGLVEYATLEGRPFARLRPGGDSKRLEALGRVLGLALRDRQPLGVDICEPLSYLLVHPDLPTALNKISALCDCLPKGVRAAGMFGMFGLPRAQQRVKARRRSTPTLDASAEHNMSASSRPRQKPREAFRQRRAAKQIILNGLEELRGLGFSREWLRWISYEEYSYWSAKFSASGSRRERVRTLRDALHDTALDSQHAGADRVSLASLPHHLALRTLKTLVLDVAEELRAVWRGLHWIPGLELPGLEAETGAGRRRRLEVEVQDAELQSLCRKRRRVGTNGFACGPPGAANDVVSADAGPDVLPLRGTKRDDTAARVSDLPIQRFRTAQRWGVRCGRRERSSVRRTAADGRSVEPGVRMMPPVSSSSSSTAPESGGTVLQGLLSGDGDVPVSVWKALTRYTPSRAQGLPEAKQTVAWFWQYVEGMDARGRASLLEWVTGFRRLPPGGFPWPYTHMTLHLFAMNSRSGRSDGTPRSRCRRLPSAHTCGFQLDLPMDYKSEADFRMCMEEALACRFFLAA